MINTKLKRLLTTGIIAIASGCAGAASASASARGQEDQGVQPETLSVATTSRGQIIDFPDFSSETIRNENRPIVTLLNIREWIVVPSELFGGFVELQAVILPNGLKRLGSNAFSNCIALVRIDLPASLTTLGQSCFEGCMHLEQINIPEGVSELPARCFCMCQSLTRVELPFSIIIIRHEVFYKCSSLADVTIKEGVITIDRDAFDCGILNRWYRIVIPRSVRDCNDINVIVSRPYKLTLNPDLNI